MTGGGGGFDLKGMMSKIFRVYFREKFMKRDVSEDLATHGMTIESELYTHEINY